MAYADHKTGIDPKSLSVTVAINGGIIAALLLLGTAAVTVEDGPTIVELINQTAPIEATPPPPTHDKASTSVVIVPKTFSPPRTTSENDLTPPFLPPLTGTGTGPIELPPLTLTPPITPPVIVIAKRDSRYARDFQPDYPPSMIRAGIEGSATVRVLIGSDGRVKAVEAVRADQDDFLNATRAQALKRWRFTPATKDGLAFDSWQQLTVRFQMPS